jgi:hypothetical protein
MWEVSMEGSHIGEIQHTETNRKPNGCNEIAEDVLYTSVEKRRR